MDISNKYLIEKDLPGGEPGSFKAFPIQPDKLINEINNNINISINCLLIKTKGNKCFLYFDTPLEAPELTAQELTEINNNYSTHSPD